MRYGSIIQRRLLKLEEKSKASSTQSKLEGVQQAALAGMSSSELKLLEEYKVNELAGHDAQGSLEHRTVVDRFQGLFLDAFVEAGPRFSIAEMDQFLKVA